MQRNAFYAYPENLLMSMINDENYADRELARRRTKNYKGNSIRTFKIPKQTMMHWITLILYSGMKK